MLEYPAMVHQRFVVRGVLQGESANLRLFLVSLVFLTQNVPDTYSW